uniref:Uncharacterized protein n=1 Tax=Anopheles farauti TaxID=69004 RepID=A0A182QAD6_9DIPT
MVNLVERTTTDTTTTTTTPPTAATDVSSLQTSFFPSSVPTAAGLTVADNRFPLFLDHQAASVGADSDNDDRISTDDERGDGAGGRSPRRIGHRALARTPPLNGTAAKKRCLRSPSEPSDEPQRAGNSGATNGIDHDHEMTSTVAAVTAAANKAVAALMQYRQQQQQSQQAASANCKCAEEWNVSEAIPASSGMKNEMPALALESIKFGVAIAWPTWGSHSALMSPNHALMRIVPSY